MKNILYLLTIMILSVTSIACDEAGCDGHNCRENRATFVSTKTGSGKWKDTITPKEGWICKEIEDIGAPIKQCEMCERETIRYIHQMLHPQGPPLSVGCICAGHMEGDLDGAKEREKYLTNHVSRRRNWLTLRGWKESKKGNPYITTRRSSSEPSHHIVIIKSKYGQFSATIDGVLMRTWHRGESAAKFAAFDMLYPAKKII